MMNFNLHIKISLIDNYKTLGVFDYTYNLKKKFCASQFDLEYFNSIKGKFKTPQVDKLSFCNNTPNTGDTFYVKNFFHNNDLSFLNNDFSSKITQFFETLFHNQDLDINTYIVRIILLIGFILLKSGVLHMFTAYIFYSYMHYINSNKLDINIRYLQSFVNKKKVTFFLFTISKQLGSKFYSIYKHFDKSNTFINRLGLGVIGTCSAGLILIIGILISSDIINYILALIEKYGNKILNFIFELIRLLSESGLSSDVLILFYSILLSIFLLLLYHVLPKIRDFLNFKYIVQKRVFRLQYNNDKYWAVYDKNHRYCLLLYLLYLGRWNNIYYRFVYVRPEGGYRSVLIFRDSRNVYNNYPRHYPYSVNQVQVPTGWTQTYYSCYSVHSYTITDPDNIHARLQQRYAQGDSLDGVWFVVTPAHNQAWEHFLSRYNIRVLNFDVSFADRNGLMICIVYGTDFN